MGQLIGVGIVSAQRCEWCRPASDWNNTELIFTTGAC
jgi:hypothetical protein